MLRKNEKTFKALGDKTRLRILNMLMAKPLCVCEIDSILPHSQSTISGHLKILRDIDLIIDSKNGRFITYQINSEDQSLNDLLVYIKKSFESDKDLIEERDKALKADRYEICKS